MVDVETSLGKPNKEISLKKTTKGRKVLTPVLIFFAVILLIYIVYSQYLVKQEFWKKLMSGEKTPVDEIQDEEDPKEKEKENSEEVEKPEEGDWDVKAVIQQIEDEQSRLIKIKDDI